MNIDTLKSSLMFATGTTVLFELLWLFVVDSPKTLASIATSSLSMWVVSGALYYVLLLWIAARR